MEDVCHRAVIPFQANQRTFPEVVTETVDVPDVRTTESVNGLVVIAHDKQRLAIPEQCLDKPVLRRIDVLIFVHQNFSPLALEKSPGILMVFEQLDGFVNKVFKDNLTRFQHPFT